MSDGSVRQGPAVLPEDIFGYKLEVSMDGIDGNYARLADKTANANGNLVDATILPTAPPGLFYFKVATIDVNGKVGLWTPPIRLDARVTETPPTPEPEPPPEPTVVERLLGLPEATARYV